MRFFFRLLSRLDGRLGAVGELQFAEDVANVGFNGLLTEGENLSNLAVAFSLSDQFEYLKFTMA